MAEEVLNDLSTKSLELNPLVCKNCGYTDLGTLKFGFSKQNCTGLCKVTAVTKNGDRNETKIVYCPRPRRRLY